MDRMVFSAERLEDSSQRLAGKKLFLCAPPSSLEEEAEEMGLFARMKRQDWAASAR